MFQPLATLKQGIRKRYYRWLSPYRDLVVVSYPKSGRTWLRVMLNDMGVVPTYTHDGSQNPRMIPCQELPDDKSAFARNRVVFMVRDPRDTVVSSYFQVTNRHKDYNGSLKDFMRDDRFGIQKVLKFHEIWDRNRSVPKDFMVVRYEDLKADTFGAMKELLQFIRPGRVKEDKLRRVIDFYEFENMHKLEKQGYFRGTYKGVLSPGDKNNQESYKTRKGKVGGYVEYMDDDDLEYARRIMTQHPNPFYPL
jgi:hypothetical protein